MSKLLEKIAEITSSLPYRERAEVLIHHKGNVLITTNHRDDGSIWHGLPGGGIEEGNTPEEAATREALEEVGVAVKNIRHSGEIGVKEGYSARTSKAHRAQMYRGSKTHLIEADYDGRNLEHYGHEDDTAEFTWMTPEEACKHLEGNSGHQQHTVLKKYIK